MRPRKATLTDQELEIMKIVWSHNEATVRDVYEKLLERRKIAYTTVMTLMKILETKGHLEKTGNDESRAYVYKPTRPQNQVIGGMVRDFVNRVFNGSAEPLLVHLVKDEGLTDKELADIVKLAREKEGRKQP